MLSMFVHVICSNKYGIGAAMWAPLNFLVGSWQGAGEGQAGTSQVERSYHFILNGKFLQATNISTYLPQERNPKGEVHEDWGIFSYDTVRKTFVFRQFHIEGFVNQYILEDLAPDGGVLAFVTESIENIPTGWRAREIYKVLNPDEFTETFELAAPDKGFEIYSENHFKRVR
jgi:hypothetical protein